MRKIRSKEDLQRQIKRFNESRNFLFVAEAKNEETKKFLEDLAKKPKRHLEIKDNGVVFVYEDGAIADITTIGEICEKLSKEIREK